jgi:hypothetical protein
MATTKLTLDMGAMQDDFFADTSMIGIVTAMQGYRLCWMINNHFDVNFIRDPQQDILLQKKDNEFYFPVYRYDLANSSHRYLLYKLKNGTETLLPETKQLDYLWLIQTANADEDAYQIAADLRNTPDIQLARILSVEELKNVKNLIV